MHDHIDDVATTDRIEPLPTLPIFFKLRGRRVLIAGGGEPAVWKAELLGAAGARVTVVDPLPCQGLVALAGEGSPGALTLERRPWQDADFGGVALALGAIESDAEAERFRAAAALAGVPVNVIDKPAFCDFQFGTLVTRGPLVLAISTDGAAPVLGQALKARLEAWLPRRLAAWATAAKRWRTVVAERNWDFRRRRRFWETFADLALEAGDRDPIEGDLVSCLAGAAGPAIAGEGRISLVGGGHGRADSLTFEAARNLQGAEIVFVDPGIAPELVALARRESEKVRAPPSEETLPDVLDLYRSGKRISWVGLGDPRTCQHWRTRIDWLRAASVEPILIDGVSSCPLCEGNCSGRPPF